ncbi:MAG TPA: hypothetical protein RMH99_32865 [Sandaracinaceae bacterium LLY-WYZ-13_1]|nr:hypothetical protein [Sandaracinaceae bacterium LLY-WYZ-13_1]
MDATPVSDGPTHRFAGVGNVLVSLHWGAPSTRALRDRVAWTEATIARHGAIGILVVVTADAAGQLPDRAFRELSRAQADRWRDAILFSASVIEGGGVSRALIRTFLRGLAVVAGRGIDVRFFDSVPGGAAWAAERAAGHGGPSAEELLETVAALRARGVGAEPEGR